MSAKRKAAATTANDRPDPKRRKALDNAIEQETPEGTTTKGLAFLAHLRELRDKYQKLITKHFLTLPDRSLLPEYYDEIALPIALDTIEAKLKNGEYPTMTTLESDLKRMVANAKSYNETSSEIFSDAEKIRKVVSNYMPKENPAYKDKDYVSFPTPIPDEMQTRSGTKASAPSADVGVEAEVDADGETDPEQATGKPRRLTLHGPSNQKDQMRRRASSTPAVQEAADAGESFEGNTFQQAQEKIMTEMIQLKNEEDQLISTPFLNLPSRELRDYYRVIKHPVCLKGAQKMVRGIRGREKPTGESHFRSWAAFEDEISYIWRNAQDYNEDRSEIFEMATELQAYFNQRLAEAKKFVQEPKPKVNLRMPAKSPEPGTKLKLRMGQKAPQEESAGYKVDDEALQRQKELVKAGTNGTRIGPNGTSPRKIPFSGTASGATSTTIPVLNQDRGRSASAASPPASAEGVKNETQRTSPSLSMVQVRHGSNASNETVQSPHLTATNMPPPSSVTPRLPSVSPHPQAASSIVQNHINHQNTNPLESRWRQPGKDASDALLTNLTIATHPGMTLNNHFRLDIPPSSTLSQQSITINLPSTHYALQILPTISANLSHRQYKLLVSVANARISPTPVKPEDTNPRRPIYDIRVLPGMNRVEVEMIAGTQRGAPKVGPGQDIEFEKVTIFVNLLR